MAFTYLHRALLSALAVSAAACAGAEPGAGGDSGSSDSDITGVTDLTEMEAALGLSKDFKNPDGSWYRGDDKLKAGACYKKLIGGPDGASYIFRRYSTGASFFKKLNAGAASGDERPVVCVDVDVEQWDGSQSTTYTLGMNDFEVDSVIRYRLGRPGMEDGAAGSLYQQFDGGWMHYVNQFCYPNGAEKQFEPLSPAELSRDCLSGAQFPGSGGEIDGAALLMVYQYAYNHSVPSNRFSSASDPVGRFIRVEGTYDSPEQIVHYENMDLHLTHTSDTTQTFTLTAKGGAAALVSCTTKWSDEGGQSTKCTGASAPGF